MTPAVTALIFANLAIHLLLPPQSRLQLELALVPAQMLARPWTAVTYMFLHAPGFAHILFNMLSLYFFGPALELRLGTRRFAQLYLVSGLTGAVVSLATPNALIVGASGAIFGVLLGFAWFWPRQKIYLWGIVGIEARWMVLIMTLLSLYGGASGARDGTAHYTHLGGFVGGWLYLVWMRWRSPAAIWQRKVRPPPTSALGALDRLKRVDPATLHPVNREEFERVMRKVEADGPGALTDGEREFLDRFAPK